ncbi:MAG: hypothetical protein ABW098_13160 [Candidatus Thiodiazotropha sp.]
MTSLLQQRNKPPFRLAMFLLSLLAVANPIAANPYQGNPQWQGMPPGQWNFAPPNHRQSGTPSQTQPTTNQSPYGTWPSRQYPGYGPQSYYSTQSQPPQLETTLSISNPYIQQGVILKLSVISQNNLRTASPSIPQSDSFIVKKLEGPVTHSRTRNGRRQIVNEFYYVVTPLRAGIHRLPTIRVSGEEEQAGSYNRGSRAFEASTAEPVELRIRESNLESQPWLPAEHLELKITLPKNLKAAAGKPFTLATEISAAGIPAEQLPSLEQQLKSDAFRVYREQSRVETDLKRSDNKLFGQRLESFTLVPQYGGDLKLPQLSINWWNTRSHMAQRASIPLHPIAVSGNRRSTGFFVSDEQSTPFPAGTSSAFWIPLTMVFGVIFGYWLAIWISHRKKGGGQHSPLEPLVGFLQRPMRQMAPAFSPLKAKLRNTTAILHPATHWSRWRRNLVAVLPLSVRFWFCVRFVDEEQDPEIWGFTLRFLANKHMGLPLNAPFSVIGKHILAFHPKARPEVIQRLIHELEESVYGHHNIDFELWKAAFKHEIRPSLALYPKRLLSAKSSSKPLLPELNP